LRQHERIKVSIPLAKDEIHHEFIIEAQNVSIGRQRRMIANGRCLHRFLPSFG
jgi:hypothetical protein